MALAGMQHDDPYVRSWSVRLIGEKNSTTPVLAKAIADLAANERQLEVIGQIASTAKRLPAEKTSGHAWVLEIL